MSFSDPIADMLTRIRNAQSREKPVVSVPASRMKEKILTVLEKEGYIRSWKVTGEKPQERMIQIELKYFNNMPVIRKVRRVSKPSRHIYTSVKKMPVVANGLGNAILSTPQGILSDNEARARGIGGEVLLYIN